MPSADAVRRSQSARANADDAIFVKDGYPVAFFFHQSVREGRNVLQQEIKRHGGEVCEDEQQANVILVDEEADIEHIRRRYYRSNVLWQQRVYIESRDFVRKCIRAGKYEHHPPPRKGMPGAPGGRVRVPYTAEDDENLAFYIATVIPDASSGGRAGNSLYQELTEELADEPEYREWAKRHTWQSWRERYKTNRLRLDPMIARYAEQLKAVAHGFGHDPRSRHFIRGRRAQREEEEEEEESDRELEQQAAGEAGPENLDNQLPGGAPEIRDRVQENGVPDHEPGPATPQLRRRRRDDPDTSQPASFQGESPQKRQRVASSATPSRPRTSAVEKRQRTSAQDHPGRNSNENDRGSPQERNYEPFAQGALNSATSFDQDQMPEFDALPMPQSPEHNVPEARSDEPLATQQTLVNSPIDLRSRATTSARATTAVVQAASMSSQAISIAQPLRAARRPPSHRGRTQREQNPAAEVRTPAVGTGTNSQVKHLRTPSKSRSHQPVVAASDPPYRHTRARSHSVDLPPQPTPASKRRRAVSAKGKSELEEVLEEDAERNVDEGGDSQVYISEEQDVEDHLKNLFTDEEDDLHSVELPHEQQEFTVDSSSEDPSDSDDAATHKILQYSGQRLNRMASAGFRKGSRLPDTSAPASKKATTKSSAIRVTRYAAQAPPFPSPGTKANTRLRERRGN
ncbi:hypothetical protein DEU56DRAFT_821836 [Suillus clintonianus]|uniref:uncharacterized protein n=1 Tax=Suillus clintonianus TaxID=1904413 RepID=UPI001B86E377|nr:uncharacterized protein DEU56DRAFT_821836 [Suillus clintonianus]KAG2126822.1 hypothetical protein DEU56DRAFT_821836 [Suillus clintonianus]